ncbi:MAG: succinyldiaminopimelate transaminase [Methylococcaceae bacterium]|jgi:N-succinyldiaminopimelate aminotransferase
MTPNLQTLQPYPFEKLAKLKQGITPADKPAIVLSIGEPSHATPAIIQEALLAHINGLSKYPTTKGIVELRETIATWLAQRYQIPISAINPDSHILPVSGTREALFSIAQCLIDTTDTLAGKPVVIMPNPFYQIYEGAALLAGAEPYFLNTTETTGYLPDFDAVPVSIWQRCQLIYICSPGNPSGAVLSRESHLKLLELAQTYDFIIASDECYSELYDDENNPPPGLLESAFAAGNTSFKNCLIFHSLSKRSNAPGLRSGFVAGDADILQSYFKYRTYQGCALPIPTQYASISAWQDEQHVLENRRLYREKFSAFIEVLADTIAINKPPASFYIWLKTPINDSDFAQQLYAQENLTVLPGSYLSRESHGINPGLSHVRIALVAPLSDCIEAAYRIKNFIKQL